ncbi:MAG: hypothetical protein HY769_09970 [Candidatus Stahlbacteria bacterium]|nr:hypothetical protein [Candidatus Stahlbacteria bacterium]
MKIGMMGGWNTDSGASFHTELVGRAWVEQGHNLKVFSFFDYAFHGTQITGRDENYVSRCFTVDGFQPANFDPIPFLTTDYEVFVAQDLGMLPKDSLGKIFHRIKNKAITINVIHDGKLSQNPSFYQFDWDVIVCFDNRYRDFLIKAYEPSRVHIIPYPCCPWQPGNKQAARSKLGLPQDKKIIYGFGPASEYIAELIDPIIELSKEYPIMLLITAKKDNVVEKFKALQSEGIIDIELREESLPISTLYDYLYAADVLVFNKPAAGHVVVSSTAFQCMGSGCPIVARSSDYVEYYHNELIGYSNFDEFKSALRSIFNEDADFQSTIRAAEEYVNKNSAQEIGKKFIKLFEAITEHR